MRIKPGVQVGGLQPEMILALMIVEPILESYGQELVLTSVTDSEHSDMSRHYVGYGTDIRSRDARRAGFNVTEIEDKMSAALGDEYYVKHEVHHFHLQFNGSPRQKL
jgi:hypothetical protein